MKKENIGLILRYSGLGLLVAVVIYTFQHGGLDIKSGSLWFLAICLLISSFLWK